MQATPIVEQIVEDLLASRVRSAIRGRVEGKDQDALVADIVAGLRGHDNAMVDNIMESMLPKIGN